MVLLSTQAALSQKLTRHSFLDFPSPGIHLSSSLPPKPILNTFLPISAVIHLNQSTIISFLSYHSGLPNGLPTFFLASLPSVFHRAAYHSASTMAYRALVIWSLLTSLTSRQSPVPVTVLQLHWPSPFCLFSCLLPYAFAFPAPSAWTTLNPSSPSLLLLILQTLSSEVFPPLRGLL